MKSGERGQRTAHDPTLAGAHVVDVIGLDQRLSGRETVTVPEGRSGAEAIRWYIRRARTAR